MVSRRRAAWGFFIGGFRVKGLGFGVWGLGFWFFGNLNFKPADLGPGDAAQVVTAGRPSHAQGRDISMCG